MGEGHRIDGHTVRTRNVHELLKAKVAFCLTPRTRFRSPMQLKSCAI